jgi:hypothetical protein
MKISIVVPTIRENSTKRFLSEWESVFEEHKIHLVVIEDNPEKTFDIKEKYYKFEISHYSWEDIEKDLGKDSWIIPRRTSAIKSYGFWKAYQIKSDLIIALDDDCYPIENYLRNFQKGDLIQIYKNNLFKNKFKETAWISTINQIRPRGLPYKRLERLIDSKQIILNHGLWANIPDLDAQTQLSIKTIPKIEKYFLNQIIPQGKYFPMCGMNIGWKRELTPAMYFMLMGKDKNEKSWGFDRFDDIWAGIFVKKICDHLGYRIISGYPIVWHDRASDPYKNLEKEKTGIKVNEYLWQEVDKIKLTKSDIKECYKELAEKLNLKNDYFKKLKKAMIIWSGLF